MPRTTFALHGPCSKYTEEHGYSQQMRKDVHNLSCTNGWTCGNLLSNAADAAYFVRALLGSDQVLSEGMRQEMLNFSTFTLGWSQGRRYGLGVMDIEHFVRDFGRGPNISFIGHGGDTYGFVSLTGYNKEYDFGVSLAINTENNLLVDTVTARVLEVVIEHRTRMWKPSLV